MSTAQTHTVASVCRNRTAYCPILVTVQGRRAVKVSGDAVAARVQGIVVRRGLRAVAVCYGSGNVTNPAGSAMARSWLTALGFGLIFSAMAIDKPAAGIALALHGHRHAGAQAFENASTWLLAGANKVIAKSHDAPMNNPAQRLKDAAERGMKLIVIDPRRSESARRAHLHLQPVPGEDTALLAGLIHILPAEEWVDRAFMAQHAVGLVALREAVARFTPAWVAQRAGVPVGDLLEAARCFGRAPKGGVACATGASFSAHANLIFYLALCLNTRCGRWAREGDAAPYPNVLQPAVQPGAQPYPPYPVFGKVRLRAHGLRESAAGMPTAALADDILAPGAGGIKALICVGGNPLESWPDQRKADTELAQVSRLMRVATSAVLQMSTAAMSLELRR